MPKFNKAIKNKLINAIEISTSWAKRCKVEFGNDKSKALFGIVQGGLSTKILELNSLEKLVSIGFDGYAMGGLAVGEVTRRDVYYFK